MSLAELETQLRALKASQGGFPIVIKGDTDVQYGKVMQILDLLMRLDITQLGLVTQRIVR